MSTRCAMGSDAYVLRLAKVREEEQAKAERVRKAEQAVIRAARADPDPHHRVTRALARLDKLTKGDR